MDKSIKRVVFKVGTSTLTHHTGKTNIRQMEDLVKGICELANTGRQVVLVSSGAIGVGVGALGLSEKPQDTPGRQAAATVGQCELMFLYDKFFSEYGHTVGQLLITKDDMDHETRRQNLLNTFEKLFEYGVIPIVNENDSVAVEEIVFGDNDTLSAEVARLVDADMLVILTDIDGLYNGKPSEDGTHIIPVVEQIDDTISSYAGGAGTSRGTGGMVSKIHAAQIANEAGIDTVIMRSRLSNMYDLFDGRHVGTLFKAEKK